MRHFTVLVAIIFLLGQAASAQDTVSFRHIYFTATLKQAHLKPIKSYLDGLSDSVIFLSPTKTPLRFYDDANTAKAGFNYKGLESVRVQRKGAAVTGFAVGAICGLVAGALIGATQNSDWLFSTGDYIVYGSLAGATFGSIIGLVCGLTAHKTFIIKGRKERFDNMKSQMLRRVTKMQ